MRASPAILSASILLAATLLFGCNASPPPPAAVAPRFDPVVDTKQLMDFVVDPNADLIWGSVGTIIDERGRQELAPKSDDEWNALRNAAVVVAESGNLLMMDGRAPNQEDWMHKARGMIEAAKTVRTAVEARDVEALFNTGGVLYQSCVACHAPYANGPQDKPAASKS